jgi:CBS domain containing-hemolysin-like protein
MAKHLGLVPIPGSQVVAHGLRFTAEDTAGRRNKIGTVRIARVGLEPASATDDTPAKEAVRD